MRPKLIYLDRLKVDRAVDRKRKKVDRNEEEAAEVTSQRLKNFDAKKVEYRNETIDAICLGFTSISDLIRANKREDRSA